MKVPREGEGKPSEDQGNLLLAGGRAGKAADGFAELCGYQEEGKDGDVIAVELGDQEEDERTHL